MDLRPHQKTAVAKLSNGKILWGGVGSGKSRTAVAYYQEKEAPRDVIVITTAKKRDTLDWQKEFAAIAVGPTPDTTVAGVLTVDSWNNLAKYMEVQDAFFIFDEQRLVGSGKWVKSFLKIAKKNHWVLLTATPGDTWMDYVPVFVANGWYKNRTDFQRQHVVYNTFTKFPKVDRYIGVGRLVRLRNEVLVEMPYERHTRRECLDVSVGYDREKYELVVKQRWNPYENRPIQNAGEYCAVQRRVVYSDPSRLQAVLDVLEQHPRLIVFYNFDYELAMLHQLVEIGKATDDPIRVAEYNGHRHDEVPETESWVYLVQYEAGKEAWNCITTDALMTYSDTYSFRTWDQSHGRIDRLDTPFTVLKYYHLRSSGEIDRATKKALDQKKSFNERKFADIFPKEG